MFYSTATEKNNLMSLQYNIGSLNYSNEKYIFSALQETKSAGRRKQIVTIQQGLYNHQNTEQP